MVQRFGRAAGTAAFVVGVAALAILPALRAKPTARQLREQLLADLRPVVLANCSLERFGGVNDGGYLMCGNLLGNVQSAYSYGIGPADDWGCAVSERTRVTVHQYDCFNPPDAACPRSQSLFHDECIGPKRETIDGRLFDTLIAQIAGNGDAGKTLVMKIDIEGAELASLMAAPDSVLDRIDQLAMEIHGADDRFLALVRRLKQRFHLVHLHFNNQACTVRYRPLPSWAYQVLFVHKRIGVPDAAKRYAVLPHPLDAPDYAQGKDCQYTWPAEPARQP